MRYFSPEGDPKINFSFVDMHSMTMLDNAREIAGIPFIITRSYSTPEHSVAVGGFRDDAHTEIPCTAFDIKSIDSNSRFIIVGALLQAGFKRVGINAKNGHIHADNSPRLPHNVLWIE